MMTGFSAIRSMQARTAPCDSAALGDDIQEVAVGQQPDQPKLTGFEDWSNIVYRARLRITAAGAGQDVPAHDDITAEEAGELREFWTDIRNQLAGITLEADLNITKVDDIDPLTLGDQLTYTIQVNNLGPDSAEDVTVSDTLPAGVTFVSATPSQGSCGESAGTVTCDLATIASGGSADVTVVVVPATVGTITNNAAVTSSTDDPVPGNNSAGEDTELIDPPDLKIEKTDTVASAIPGETVVYSLAYSNLSVQDAVGVKITETVPSNTTFNAGAGTGGWVCTPDDGPGASCVLNLGVVAGESGGSVDFAVDLATPEPSGLTQIENTATIEGEGGINADPNPSDNSSSETTPVDAAPNLQITKVGSSNAISAGGTLTYVLSYANVGNQDAIGVAITETVPNNATFNPSIGSVGWSCTPVGGPGSTCTFVIGAVSAGSGGSVDFAVDIDDPLDGSVLQISNTASVTDDSTNGPDLNPADNSDDENTAIAVTEGRMTGGGRLVGGDGIRYTHSFGLKCDVSEVRNNLKISWGKGNNFHLTELTAVTCVRQGLEGKPVAGFDTIFGEGIGVLNGEPVAPITFRFTDRGEPGKGVDEAGFSISGGPNIILNTLDGGNHQSHPEKSKR